MGGSERPQSGNRIVKVGRVIFGADREVADWIARKMPSYTPDTGVRALAVVSGDKIAAAVAFERFNGAHIETSIAAELNGRWADKKTLRTLFSYPFEQLGVEAITVLVASTNLPSLNLAVKLGFEPQAYIRFAAHDGSTLIVLQMYKNTCRWLEHGKRQQRGASGTGPLPNGIGGSAIQPS